MARDIFMHPTGKEKFRLDQYGQYGDGRSALHLVAELGNVELWNLAVERPDCDLKVIFDKIDSLFFSIHPKYDNWLPTYLKIFW